MDNESITEPSRKRLRTSHACDTCRARKIRYVRPRPSNKAQVVPGSRFRAICRKQEKINDVSPRCNGNTPCASCSASQQECTYGSEANSRGKSDLILEGVLRVEKFLHEMKATIVSPAASSFHFSPNPSHDGVFKGAPPFTDSRPAVVSPALRSASRGSFSGSPLNEIHHPQRTPISEPLYQNNYENAVLDSMHTSTTESILQWPHFEAFPSMKDDYVSIFHLEQSRPVVKTRSTVMYPYVTAEEIDGIIESFELTINFWYPTMSCGQLAQVRKLISDGIPEEDSILVCLALLTMALGCAGQVTAGLTTGTTLSEEERKRRLARRAMGDMYFDSVLKKLHVVHTNVGSTATHCLFFTAMYFAFLRRPLQAWEYINAASAKCLLLLSYSPESESEEDQERIRRIFWSCYILESDYLAELNGLPQSGIARIESSTALPGQYNTHRDSKVEEKSSLYFLACISMRRLLNRVHQLLYARDTGTALDHTRFPYVVAELNHQLDEWRDVLPAAFKFEVGFNNIGNQSTPTEHGGFLRQRYLTCRSVIYRPYLMWMLSGRAGRGEANSELLINQDSLNNCKACLDACLLHILNLRGFGQTVLVDTWICSLSMAGAMLVLLAACRIPQLKDMIPSDILGAGDHLKQLLQSWQSVMGDPTSPSVDQSIRMISDADRFIQEVYHAGDSFSMRRR
ncbi:Echinocandin B biosynthetic cluster transcription factor ecdB [Colletotrichum siamense]|uniref:Echinocandin B biosynthetic cluster transcription factor ecdB n=1 Tax=Colletotrichum siamense TaxID=690259 RepID=UPI001872295B|nr:Echinocandin B biosynthetic cluster transcription factor ecdB [Colletotrichum siamense]KAF5505147.1 Echinocandin B biosynthetic cluster transcription factor ecdB [Colletotrichum siamense]